MAMFRSLRNMDGVRLRLCWMGMDASRLPALLPLRARQDSNCKVVDDDQVEKPIRIHAAAIRSVVAYRGG